MASVHLLFLPFFLLFISSPPSHLLLVPFLSLTTFPTVFSTVRYPSLLPFFRSFHSFYFSPFLSCSLHPTRSFFPFFSLTFLSCSFPSLSFTPISFLFTSSFFCAFSSFPFGHFCFFPSVPFFFLSLPPPQPFSSLLSSPLSLWFNMAASFFTLTRRCFLRSDCGEEIRAKERDPVVFFPTRFFLRIIWSVCLDGKHSSPLLCLLLLISPPHHLSASISPSLLVL